MHYLVTGGCGFIGNHLCAALREAGHDVTVLDDLSTGRKETLPAGARLVTGSVTDAALVRTLLTEADGCFHLAAIASVVRCTEDWVESHQVNLGGAIHVFDAARIGRRPVVYASSAAVYGNPLSVPLGEDAATSPISAYGADKLGCELHGAIARQVYGVPALGLRFFNVYGPGQNPDSVYSGVISIFIRRALAEQPITIFGDGTQTRDFIHVRDVVAHLIAGMQQLETGADVPISLNVCTGKGVTVLELAKTILQAAQCDTPVSHAPAREGDIRRSIGDPSLAVASLKTQATIPLAEGLKETIDAIRAETQADGA